MNSTGSMTTACWASALAIALSWGCDPDGEYTSHPQSFALPGLPGLPGQVALTQVSFSPNPAGLVMYAHVPDDMPAGPAPLIVVLHGCLQSAQDHAAEAGWNALADRLKFYVVYAEQTLDNNPARCFNWAGVYGDPANMIRGKGENASIVSMVNTMKAQHPGKIDPGQIYIVGFSAGGYMAAVMLATWPDLFSAGAIMEGGPYHCADNVQPAFDCMKDGQIHNSGSMVANATPKQWGDLIRNKAGHNSYWSNPPSVPRLMIWHGTADTTVYPPNQQSLIEQWTDLFGISTSPSSTGSLAGHAYQEFEANGTVVVTSFEVSGLRHAVAIDPGGNADQGGTVGGYSQDVDIYAPYHTALFFGLGTTGGNGASAGSADTVAPQVDITSPADGATVKGQVAVTVAASDNVGVTQVQLLVDGALVDIDTSEPFEFIWDTTVLDAGPSHGFNGSSVSFHALSAVATDAAGNSSTDDDTVVRIDTDPAGSIGSSTDDASAPTVSFSNLNQGINNVGTLVGASPVTVSGTASDDTGVTKVELSLHVYPNAACLGTAAAVTTDTASGTTSWSYDLDVAALKTFHCYRLEARAHDAAGNISEPAQAHLYVMNKTSL